MDCLALGFQLKNERTDFFNSLLAAYRIEEVQEHLRQADLDNSLSIGMVSRIQMVVKGIIS